MSDNQPPPDAVERAMLRRSAKVLRVLAGSIAPEYPGAAATVRSIVKEIEQALDTRAKAAEILSAPPAPWTREVEPIGWRLTWDQRLGVQLAHGGSHTVWHRDLLPGMEEEARTRRTEPGVVNVKIIPLYDRPALAAAPLDGEKT